MDVEFDCDFRLADAHVAIGARWIQDTWDQQFLPEVGTFVQEDLERNNKGGGGMKRVAKVEYAGSLSGSSFSFEQCR